MANQLQTIIFGGGCFWCSEAVFQRVKGVKLVISGYAGGDQPHPTYEEVSTGESGHAEVIKVEYDPSVINLEDLLAVFFSMHDPTQVDRQGPDVGSQYRSVIFFTTSKQRDAVQKFIQQLSDQGVFEREIATQLQPLKRFYPAEDYHQNYYNKNTSQSYCQLVINPKLEKLKKQYVRLLR